MQRVREWEMNHGVVNHTARSMFLGGGGDRAPGRRARALASVRRTAERHPRTPRTRSRLSLPGTGQYALEVVSEPAMRFETTVAFMVPVGSRNETSPDEHGMSHVLEHLVFKGGRVYPDAQAVSTAVEHLGGYMNAYTSHEMTFYHITGPAAPLDGDPHRRTLAFVDILSDIVCRPAVVLDPSRGDEMDREKQVIKGEIEKYEDMPERHVHTLSHRDLFGGPGGDEALAHDIAGTVAGVLGMDNDLIRDYWRRHYARPLLLIAGHFERPDELADRVRSQMRGRGLRGGGSWDPAPFHGGRGAFLPEFRLWQGERLASDSRVPRPVRVHRQRGVAQAHMVLAFPVDLYGANGTPLVDRLTYVRVLGVLAHVLGGGMSSRLWREVREKRGLAYSVSCGVSVYVECAVVTVATSVHADKWCEARDVILDELRRAGRCITPDEARGSSDALAASCLMSSPSSRVHLDHLVAHLARPDVPLTTHEDEIAVLGSLRDDASLASTLRRIARFVFLPANACVTVLVGEEDQ